MNLHFLPNVAKHCGMLRIFCDLPRDFKILVFDMFVHCSSDTRCLPHKAYVHGDYANLNQCHRNVIPQTVLRNTTLMYST